MLPTPVLSVSGKGFARLRISAWHFSPAPPILYAVQAIVYHKNRVLSRVLRDFSGGKAPGTPGAEPARHWLSLPRWHPAGGLPSLSPAYPAFTFFFAPYPPSPLPRWGRGRPLVCFSAPSPLPLPRRGRGRPKVYFAGGFAPGTPALNRLRHLQNLPYRFPAQGSLRFGVKPTERRSLEQCR